jgi:hypothetical protein
MGRRGPTVQAGRPGSQDAHHQGATRRRHPGVVHRLPPQPAVARTRPRGPPQPPDPLGYGPAPADGVGGRGPPHRGAKLPQVDREPLPPAQPGL